MNILVFAGCNDKKLLSKIKPLLESQLVDRLYLLRESKMNYDHPKLIQYPPKELIRKFMPIRELYRFLMGLYIVLFKHVRLIIGIHFLMHGVYAYILGTVFNRKYIHLIIENPRQYTNKGFFKHCLKNSHAIGVRGGNSKKYLESLGIDGSKVFIPHNEFTMPKKTILKEFKDKKYDILFIGHFIDRKDVPLWVNTFEECNKVFGTLKGAMLGEGILRPHITQMIDEKGLAENIEIFGDIPDVNPVINDSKVLLITSDSEGLPMVAVEAMSFGVPVVSSNVGDVSDLVKDGLNGYLVDTRNPDDYKLSVMKLLTDRSRYDKFSEASLQFAKDLEKKSTLQSLVKIWEPILKAVK